MASVIFLGVSNAIPTGESDGTHLVIAGSERMVLVDSGSNPLPYLDQVGLNFNDVTDLILTHFHPDHVSGVPLFLMDMWLMGRQRALSIYGLEYTIDKMEAMMGLYNWSAWQGLYPIQFHRLLEKELTPVFDCADFSIRASPVRHMLPNIGLRVEFLAAHKVMAYSCDTEPCDEVVRLSAGADVLIHEATGAEPGHTSAVQAGVIASRAEVGKLLLVHYATGKFAKGDLAAEAAEAYGGEVQLVKKFMVLDF